MKTVVKVFAMLFVMQKPLIRQPPGVLDEGPWVLNGDAFEAPFYEKIEIQALSI